MVDLIGFCSASRPDAGRRLRDHVMRHMYVFGIGCIQMKLFRYVFDLRIARVSWDISCRFSLARFPCFDGNACDVFDSLRGSFWEMEDYFGHFLLYYLCHLVYWNCFLFLCSFLIINWIVIFIHF